MTQAVSLSAGLVLLAAVAFETRPHDRLAQAAGVGAVLAVRLLVVGSRRGWYSNPYRSGINVNIGIAVGPSLLITLLIIGIGPRHGLWVHLAIGLEVLTVAFLATATCLRSVRG
jgi:hypothetical protein